MALDQIWKQQLALVTYGNAFLRQNLSLNQWHRHAIFNRHVLAFRDLLSQHLLAQHFQVWLEGLKQQGVSRISLHSSTILNDEQNPNANVELLAFAHFIVSHQQQQKSAWILGKELAEWYNSEDDFKAPLQQQSTVRHETFWRFQLSPKLIKRVEADLQQPDWDEIQHYMDHELFNSRYAQQFQQPAELNLPFYGQTRPIDAPDDPHADSQYLPLLPDDHPADYVHQTLHRLDALSAFIQTRIRHPYDDNGEILAPDEQLDLRHFAQKTDELAARFIVKAANHYPSARLTPKVPPSPFDTDATEKKQTFHTPQKPGTHKASKSGVLTLIIVTLILCLCAYYFGL
ncbi:hypothetical protein [Acinetobacter sp. WZC-1]|uniref:hypothetical protein n=1 Tax=Acinetobacter sp. WZC-1 TaxID=3459034 RepID=UPI00403E3457